MLVHLLSSHDAINMVLSLLQPVAVWSAAVAVAMVVPLFALCVCSLCSVVEELMQISTIYNHKVAILY